MYIYIQIHINKHTKIRIYRRQPYSVSRLQNYRWYCSAAKASLAEDEARRGGEHTCVLCVYMFIIGHDW